jgi:vanillate O-demethylase monooxygenase subunit
MSSASDPSRGGDDDASGLRDFYYPVAQSRLLGARPLERSIAGRTIALFRDRAGVARALDARCPHRGANLAGGEVTDGCLACPYHGWRFDERGRCVHVPSQPERPVPESARTDSFDVVEQQGLVWVCTGERARGPVPRFPLLDDPAYERFTVERVVPGPFDWWIDNFSDLSHVPFVHARTFGGRHPAVQAYPIERRDDELGFSVRTVARYHYGLLARLLHGSIGPYTEDVRTEVTVPSTVYSILDFGRGRRQALALLATPEDADGARTRVIVVVARNYLRWAPFGAWFGRRFTSAVLDEDARVAARSLDPRRAPGRASVAADGPSLEYARLLRRWRVPGQ